MNDCSPQLCTYCSGDYATEIVAYAIRRHTSSDSAIMPMTVRFCPNCGRRLCEENAEINK